MTDEVPSVLEVLEALDRAAPDRAARADAWKRWEPHQDPTEIPPGFRARGVSTLRRGDGSIALQWQKTATDADAQHQAVLDAFASVAASIPRTTPTPAPKGHGDADLLNVIPLGDPHLGLYAWAQETGDRNFDLKIASHELRVGVDHMIARLPDAHSALLVPLGDFFHSDNAQNRTARSGHALDVDGRYGKIASAGVAVVVYQILALLRTHRRVTVRIEIGNHDDHSSQWLALCLMQRFHDEPRVEIHGGDGCKFWYCEFGKNLLGTTHGDTVKRSGPSLAEIMAHDRPDAWGRTTWRRWLVGHVHNLSVHERPGVEIETHRTNAARDGWTASAGYRAGQGFVAYTLSRNYGEVSRVRVSQLEINERYRRKALK